MPVAKTTPRRVPRRYRSRMPEIVERAINIAISAMDASQDSVALQATCRQLAPSMLSALATIALDLGCPPSARINAAKELLDRGYGKPTQSVQLVDETGEVLEHLGPVERQQLLLTMQKTLERDIAKAKDITPRPGVPGKPGHLGKIELMPAKYSVRYSGKPPPDRRIRDRKAERARAAEIQGPPAPPVSTVDTT